MVSVSDIHVIVVSSVAPERTSAGQLLLYRHLVDQPGLTFEVYGDEPARRSLSELLHRITRRLSSTRFHRFVQDLLLFWRGRWIDTALPIAVSDPTRTVVLTVAHGDGFLAAQRFAKRHGLPLVSFFHDWWPDIPRVHSPFRQMIERRFLRLAKESAASLCVCEGMVEALGAPPNATVLYPIPCEPATNRIESRFQVRTPSQPFKTLYFGNLADYGPMLGDALDASLPHADILLQVRGANPAWSDARKEQMRQCGRWLDFAPRAELDEWLASANAFLVAMVFDRAERRRMETCFPSKLVEFVQFGKPIVIWGPEYCSAVRWARSGNKAFCVTTPDPAELLAQLSILSRDADMADRLAASARCAAEAEFNYSGIQEHFRAVISDLRQPRTP